VGGPSTHFRRSPRHASTRRTARPSAPRPRDVVRPRPATGETVRLTSNTSRLAEVSSAQPDHSPHPRACPPVDLASNAATVSPDRSRRWAQAPHHRAPATPPSPQTSGCSRHRTSLYRFPVRPP